MLYLCGELPDGGPGYGTRNRPDGRRGLTTVLVLYNADAASETPNRQQNAVAAHPMLTELPTLNVRASVCKVVFSQIISITVRM